MLRFRLSPEWTVGADRTQGKRDVNSVDWDALFKQIIFSIPEAGGVSGCLGTISRAEENARRFKRMASEAKEVLHTLLAEKPCR